MTEPQTDVDDSFGAMPTMLGQIMAPKDDRPPAPMATCSRDDEPLICTMEFRGAEFYCQVCGAKYGYMAPKPAEATSELNARYTELKAQYDIDRAARKAAGE